MSLLSNFFASSNKEERFWNWFINNKDKIKQVSNDQSYIQTIGSKIKNYNRLLTFEIGIKEDNTIEFIISCDGISEGIPFVEKLANSAPMIDGVQIIKFRQPKKDSLTIQIDDIKLSSDDIYVIYHIDNKVHIQFFIQDYNPHDQRYGQIAFILLDNIIGEYSVMTKIGNISFSKLESNSDKTKMIPLTQIEKVLQSIMN